MTRAGSEASKREAECTDCRGGGSSSVCKHIVSVPGQDSEDQ